MTSLQHMLVVVGARPQFIKAAALHRVMKDFPHWTATWLHTGQHHDRALSHQFFEELCLPKPDVTLTPRATSRALRLGDMMDGIQQAIRVHRPGWILVFGDTDSTLAGAWAAAAEGVPLVHVEAGLRSHQWSMPEEVNRVLTDRLSSVLVCPTDAAVKHLQREGLFQSEGQVSTPGIGHPLVLRTGDIMHDNAVHYGSAWPLDNRGNGPVLLTMHRPVNVDDFNKLRAWLDSISAWLKNHKLTAAFPVHPRTANVLNDHWPEWREALNADGIQPMEPMSYLDLLEAVANAPLVVTDSGGVQKEAYSMGTRCVVLRETTEWLEQVEAGQSVLVREPKDFGDQATQLLQKGRFETGDLYGNGNAAADIFACLDACQLKP